MHSIKIQEYASKINIPNLFPDILTFIWFNGNVSNLRVYVNMSTDKFTAFMM